MMADKACQKKMKPSSVKIAIFQISQERVFIFWVQPHF